MNAIKAIAVAFVMMGISGQLFASDFFVLPKKDNVGVYQNEIRRIYEEPAFNVSTTDVLVVMQSGKNHYFVKNRNDETGWIEKQECVKAPRGARITVDSAIIKTDWDDIQRVIYVGISTIIDNDPITLNRSFKTEILMNTDKEELVRSRLQ